ncbi:hypothetical protein GE061_017423 [Apolygus lucorum]|uniref:Attractin/MKLN-like beta-propeller domain-containing protein n=1 Tax=Apolygus lucorum TaxID=248454 RepID=A0A8S9XCD7_APOLU|nr:hypothetical protein GE061_017423 [Apolygus lucorum]
MRRGVPPCDEIFGNPDIKIISRGLDLLDLRLENLAPNLNEKEKRWCGHILPERDESCTSGHTSTTYASSSNSSILLNPNQIAKLFNPDKKGRRSNKLKSSKKSNDASDLNNMKSLKTSSKQVGDYHNDSKLCQRVKSPGSKNRDIYNLDADLTDLSSSTKLSNSYVMNPKRCLSRKSTKFSKSRKRSTMSVVKEGKFEFHCGDYFRFPPSHRVPSGMKITPDEKTVHFQVPVNPPRSSVDEPRGSPTLESMGLFKDGLDVKSVRTPPKKSIHDALYQRVAYFVNPDISCYSEYFEELKNENEVNVDGVSKGAFIAIYNWMLAPDYEGLRFIQKNNILHVLIASKRLIVKELENQCLAFIDSKEAFSEENAFMLFIDASTNYQTEIMELMVPRIQVFFLVLVSSHEYNVLQVNDLCTILQSNYIVVHCELEDGLAYSVERGLTGKTEHHAQRCELLKLKVPEPRNWANKRKDYKSYGEFLNYLSEISKDPRSFYSDVKKDTNEINSSVNEISNTSSSSSDESDENKINRFNQNITKASSKKPSLSDLLCKEKFKQGSKNLLSKVTETSDQKRGKSKSDDKHSAERSAQTERASLKNRDIFHETSTQEKRFLKPTESTKRISLRERAAIVIQATYRGHALRKRLRNHMKLDMKESMSPRKLTFDRMFLQVKHDDNSYNDGTTDDDLPLILKRGRRKSKSKTTFKRSSSTDSNESIVSVKEGPGIRRMPLPYHHTKSLILIGGINPTSKHPSGHEACQIYRFSLENNSWDKIDKMPSPRYYHGSALLKGKIYIVGGCNPENEDNNMPSLCSENFSYEPMSGSWSKEPELKTPRRSFGLVTFCNHLYAIGGQDRNDTNLSSVERFDPIKRVWEEVAPLPVPIIGAAISVYKNLIWVAGGMSGSTSNVNVSKAVWCYDPRQDVWSKKPCLRFGRAFASLATYEDYLFLVGGITSENGGIASNDHIDVWDSETGVWKLKGNIDLPRHGHSVAFLGSLMILMGGVSTTNVKGLNQVDSLCMVTGSRSKQIAPLPSPLVGHSCVLLPPIND